MSDLIALVKALDLTLSETGTLRKLKTLEGIPDG